MSERSNVYHKYGFLSPRSQIAHSGDEAAALATAIGFPVVLKVVSPDIVHKTDVGGVALGLDSPEAVRAAYARMIAAVRDKAPEARIDGIRVEEMCQEGVEIIIGLINDGQFGPSVMVGMGGIFTEVLHDVSFRVLPISRDDARAMIGELRGHVLLEGYRGQPAVSREMLLDLLMKASVMGLDLADRLGYVDFNPILVWDDQHRVLDAKISLRSERVPLTHREPDTSHLDTFFGAKSVALVGASATPGKIGNAVLDSLSKHDYRGRVYPVNPTRREIMGLKAYRSLSSIQDDVDLVVVTVALAKVPDIIRECATKAVHNMVIVSGGGKELGGEGEEIEATIKRLAEESDVRVIGPNCIGVFDGGARLDTFFQVHERMTRPSKGSIGVLTQSGTVGAAFLEAMSDVGISKFISYGNRADVDEADIVAYLGDDPGTKVIVCYVEGLGDGRKFIFTAREVAERKPVVIFKAARTHQAARASISHTGFFGGTYEVCRGAFKQAGLIAVDSLEELCAVAKALALQPPAMGLRVGMISNGAGTVVQAIDFLPEYGLELIPLAAGSVERLRQVFPPYFLVQNPIDVTGSATSAEYEIGIDVLLDDPHVDIIMPWFVFQDTPLDEGIVRVLGACCKRRRKPILAGAMGGDYTQRMSRLIEGEGVPVYHSVRDWVSAAKGLAHGRKSKEVRR
jgi:3-hydroxypropionyl-CoA synthetase (ADP-forming)